MQDVAATVALNFNSSCNCMRVARIFRWWVYPGVDPGFLVCDELTVLGDDGLFVLAGHLITRATKKFYT